MIRVLLSGWKAPFHGVSFLTLLFLFQPSVMNAQTTKILFIGSSLTGWNYLPAMFVELAETAGKEVLVENGALAGHNLEEHLNVPETLARLTMEEWDYVVLENGDYSLMSNDTKDNVWATVDTYINMIHEHCSETKIIFFMDWAMKYGVYQDGISYSYEEYQQKIYEATMEIANSKDMIVAPNGSAWSYIVENKPSLELYSADNGHPSLLGSYLGACIYYTIIFEGSVEGNTYYNTISEQDALYLQSIASTTVMENLELWNVITSVEDYNNDSMIHKSYRLFQNYPNPFNPSTTIEFELRERSVVDLEIFNSLGVKINTLVYGIELPQGVHNFQWNGTDNYGNKLSSGIYFYRLKTGLSLQTKSMILLK